MINQREWNAHQRAGQVTFWLAPLLAYTGHLELAETRLHTVESLFWAASNLVAQEPSTANMRQPTSALIEPLSDCEEEIMRISIYTVRKHLNNVFEKLDVTSRTEAIARTRHLGLL